MRNIYLFIIIITIITTSCNNFSTVNPNLIVSKGSIQRIEDFPSQFVSPRNIDIWLPDNYNKNIEYSVLYMHDGQMLYDAASTWNNQEWGVDETVSDLLNKGKIKNTIVVGIWNSGISRHSDYFPQKPFESLDPSYQDSLLTTAKRYNVSTLFSNGLQADNYLKFIVNELKPVIDIKYSTKSDPVNTLIMGSSMGGLISMYAICEYPDVFGCAGCLSTHWPGTFTIENNPIPQSFVEYLSDNIPDPDSHFFYFDYGTKTLDSLYENTQLKIDSVMIAAGYDNSNWRTIKYEGDDHSEKSWRKRLHVPLEFLLKK